MEVLTLRLTQLNNQRSNRLMFLMQSDFNRLMEIYCCMSVR